MELTIKEIVKDNIVTFSHYRAGYLYYNVIVYDQKYIFPVDIEDIGDASFLNQDKAIIMMRYIRKGLNDGTFIKSE